MADWKRFLQWSSLYLAVSAALLVPAKYVDAQHAGTTKQEPVSTTAVIDTVLAVAGAAAGVNATVTTSAEVRAVATSDGPDVDDKALQGDQDVANTPLETDLFADTLPSPGNIALGLNGGDTSIGSSSHKGRALIHAVSPLTTTDWRPTLGNFAYASAKPDSTPVRGENNATAVASIGTFHFLGAEAERPFRVSEQSSSPKQGTYLGVSLPDGAVDVTQRSTGAVMWSLSQFSLEETGAMVTVTPPVDKVELFHDFVQLSTSPRYRRPYQAGIMPAGLAKDLLDEQFAQANADRDAAVGTIPLTASNEADFTLGGATLVLEPATLARNGMTDRELVEAYLTSGAVSVTGPAGAQSGYAVQPVTFELIGGTLAAPDGTLFAENGGFDAYLAQMEVEGIRQPEDMIGLLVETEGSLLDAMNLAAQDPNHPLYAILNAKAAGDTIKLDLLFQQSNSVTSASENTAGGCIMGDAALQETFVALAGAEFCQVALENAQMLETDVPTVNSNQLLAAKVPECVTEIQEMAGGVTTLAAKASGKTIGCGVTGLGLVVCPGNSAGEPTGECIVLGMVLSSFVPEADLVNSYQFGFVFDSDGNSGNNWVPAPQFANDYFQDTDLWYAVEYSPAAGWRLNVTSTGKQSPRSSAARAIIRGNAITLVAPRSEFVSSTPRFRLTAFRHSGDYGQNPPYNWSADYHPRMGKPLASIPGLATTKTSCFGCSGFDSSGMANSTALTGDLALVFLAIGVLAVVARARRWPA